MEDYSYRPLSTLAPAYRRQRTANPLHRAAPTLVAAVLAIAYLIVRPPGADLPAQLYRAHLFSVAGFSLWDNGWYGGHNLLAYSVLYPPLGWLLTPRLLGALAAVATAAVVEVVAYEYYGPEAWVGATWFGAATVVELVSGRLTFALGLLGVALTVLALQRDFYAPSGFTRTCAILAALLTALASPVAALFAALGGLTVLIVGPEPGDRMTGLLVLIAALLPVLILALLFPEGGHQPFAFSTLWPVLVAAIVIAILADGPALTVAAGLYAVGCTVAFLVHTPVGANAARLGELVAGPLIVFELYRRRDQIVPFGAVVLLAAIPLAYIQVKDAVTDTVHGTSGHAYTDSYYAPLISYLRRQPGGKSGAFRVEIPFTLGHWETYYVAKEIPLARGWERQLDVRDDSLFYGDRNLDATAYERWLHALAVRYVAVPDAPLDPSARAEVALIRSHPSYLKPVTRLRNWLVYEVRGAPPIVSGAATLMAMKTNSLDLHVSRKGQAMIRVRWSPYWKLTGVPGCVTADHGFTEITARATGAARLVTGFAPDRVGAKSSRCG
jgi:hypothetical protein